MTCEPEQVSLQETQERNTEEKPRGGGSREEGDAAQAQERDNQQRLEEAEGISPRAPGGSTAPRTP